MIRTEGLTKQFDQFVAVNDVNLEISSGQVLVLLGPNGAGKTTTVRMLTSILKPTRGSATVAGFDVVKQPDQVRASVGVLTEHHGLYGRMNALEYLDFFSRLYGIEKTHIAKRIMDLLEQFGLAQDQKKRLSEYSKGMRQKLALVRALIHEPPVLLLDEPTSAMDPESARMVRDSILNLRSADRTIILCTHNLLEAEELADKIAIIRAGRIILNDTLECLKYHLLGTEEFEAKLSSAINITGMRMPEGVTLVSQMDHILRFSIENPDQNNSKLIRLLMKNGAELVTFQKVHRSLEMAYLIALSKAAQGVRYDQ